METETERSSGKLRWAVVGTGVIAQQFAADITHCTNATLTAVCSRSMESSTAFGQKFNVDNCYDSVGKMLNDTHVDAVYVATPNHTHFSTAKEVIDAGKPVMIEKPITNSVHDTEVLAQLAVEKQVFMMEAMWPRFLPAWQHMKHLLDAEELGPIKDITADLAFNHPYEEGSRFHDLKQGGGSLRDLGVYPISLALFLLGKPAAANGTWMRGQGGVDISAQWAMVFDTFSAQFSCAIDREGRNTFLVECEEGALLLAPPFIGARGIFRFNKRLIPLARFLESGNGLSKAVRAFLKRVTLPGVTYEEFEFPGSGLQFEIEAASLSILAGLMQDPTSPLQDCCEVLDLIEKMLESEPENSTPS